MRKLSLSMTLIYQSKIFRSGLLLFFMFQFSSCGIYTLNDVSIDYTKIKTELGWEPAIDFMSGLKQTVEWYKNNQAWWKKIKQ
jgi:hypothetical protein